MVFFLMRPASKPSAAICSGTGVAPWSAVTRIVTFCSPSRA
jgi:hypothetical protein